MIGSAKQCPPPADAARRKAAANIVGGTVALRFLGTRVPRQHGGDVNTTSIDRWWHVCHQSLSPYVGACRLMWRVARVAVVPAMLVALLKAGALAVQLEGCQR